MASSTSALPTKRSSQHQQHYRTLGSLLKYFEDMPLRVELKNGRIYSGRLSSAEVTMTLTLVDVSCSTSHRVATTKSTTTTSTEQPPPSLATASVNTTTTSTTTISFPLLTIRASTIRYIHFPDQVDLAGLIQAGIQREKEAAQKYKRGVRK